MSRATTRASWMVPMLVMGLRGAGAGQFLPNRAR